MEVNIANFTQTVLPIATGLAQFAGNMRNAQGFGSFFMAFLGEGAGGAAIGGAGACAETCAPAEAEESSSASGAAPPAPNSELDENQLLALFAAFVGGQAPLVTTGVPSSAGEGLAPTSAGPQSPASEIDALFAGMFPERRGPSAQGGLAEALAAIAGELQVEFDPQAAVLRSPWQRLFEKAAAGEPPPANLDGMPTEAALRSSRPAGLAPQPPAASPVAVALQPPRIPTEADAVVRSAGNGQSTTPAAPVTEATVLDPAASTAADAPVAAPGQPGRAQAVFAEAAEEVAPPPPAAAPELPEGIRQVGRATLEQIARGGGEARIRLDPAELGQVTLHVRQHGDRIELDIVAQRPEAAQLLKDHAQDLTTIFGRQGLDLHVQVGLGGRHGQHGDLREQFAWLARARGQSDTRFAEILGIDPGANAERSNRVRGAYNPDGRHMYRI